MKDFNEFREKLNDGLLEEIMQRAEEGANKATEEAYRDEYNFERLIANERNYSDYVAFEMLKEYHKWLST